MLQTGNNTQLSFINDTRLSEIEYLSLAELLSLAEHKLSKSLARGGALPLYKKKWLEAGIRKVSDFKLEELRRFPYINKEELTLSCRNPSSKDYAGKHVQLWNNADLKSSSLCWLPRGIEDVAQYVRYAARISRVLELRDDDRILVLSQPAPDVANLLPYALACALKESHIGAQIIQINVAMLTRMRNFVEFLFRNRATVMIAQPDAALELSEILLSTHDAQVYPADHLSHVHRKLLPDLRLILLYGPDTFLKYNQVSHSYQVDTRISFGLADLNLCGMECSAQQGVHLWLDSGIYEIITQNEIDKEQNRQGYIPISEWLWETDTETRGELVITNFSEILPLIRFRTGYVVESLGHDTCRCGRTHPRVKLS
jgi:phenylacetate-coenzyme A ligase PaaK-like adenylate-forming protein